MQFNLPSSYMVCRIGARINTYVSLTAASGSAAADVLCHRDLNDL